MFQLKECIFWTKSHQISTFWTFHLVSSPGVGFCVNFAPFSNILAKNISVKCKWNFLEAPLQSVYIQRSYNLLFQHIIFLMFPHFQKYLNPEVRRNKLVNSVFYHLFLQDQPNLRDTSFHSSLNSLGFYISRMLVEFSLTCIFQHVWEKVFLFMVFLFLENALNLAFLLMASSPTQKPRQNFFKICFPKAEGVGEAMICSIKIQSENIKITWNTKFIHILYDL